MSAAKSGDTVRIHYTGKLEDGTQFDSSEGRDPLEFALGGGQVIPGFDSAVEGMAVGDRKSVTIQPEEAYGPHYEAWAASGSSSGSTLRSPSQTAIARSAPRTATCTWRPNVLLRQTTYRRSSSLRR